MVGASIEAQSGLVIGVDPGAHGALAFLRGYVGALAGRVVLDMPLVEVEVNRRRRQVVDVRGLWAHVVGGSDGLGPRPCMAFIERVGVMPGEGVHSCWMFGRYLGYLEMAFTAAGIPWEFVTPQAWKKTFGLLNAPKDQSRAVASRLFPTADLSLKKHQGRADALLIAEWGRRELARRGGHAVSA